MKFIKITICIFSLALFTECFSQQSGDNLFDISAIHEIRINFSQSNFWEILTQNFETAAWGAGRQPQMIPASSDKMFYENLHKMLPAADEDDVPFLGANITIDGVALNNVGIRLKGFSSYFSSPYFRKSIKIDINANNDTLNYFGLKKLNLNNGVGDPSLQRDAICYYLMRKAGVAAPRTSFVKVYLNNIYWGIYSLVEQVDNTFLEDNFASGKGNLFKAIGWSNLEYISENFGDYAGSIELKTNEETSNGSDFVRLVKNINSYSGKNFIDSIQRLFYVDYYFKVMSIDIITKNWDSFIQHGRNFYLYHEPVSDMFYWIPWDYNLALDGQFTGWGDQTPDTCNVDFNFSYDTLGTIVHFHFDTTAKKVQNIWWDFGDGTGSWDDFKPVHTYSAKGIFPVRASVIYQYGCYKDILQPVILIDTADICPTVLSTTTAYYPGDTSYNAVYRLDDYCCECGWDKNCALLYSGIQNNTPIDDYSYPIEYYQGGKPMIDKLLADNSMKKRYLDIFKFILDSVFIEDEIFRFIDSNITLIRPAVYADTNYIFTTEDFEYDINTLCSAPKYISNLQRFISKRRAGLMKEYASLNYTPSPVDKPVNKMDVVVNEIAANNTNEEGISKPDWIELYNNTKVAVPLKYFSISDDFENPDNFLFPENAAIRPDGYVIIWADKKDKKNNLHAGFKLAADGEEVILIHRKYGTIDSIKYGPQPENKSYSRFPNGTGYFTEMEPTFNAKNIKYSEIDEPIINPEDASFVVFPNPASDYLNVIANSSRLPAIISIYNSQGEKVFTENLVSDKNLLDVRTFPNGLYLLQIDSFEQLSSIKIIINH